MCNPGVTDADLPHIRSMDLGKLNPDTDIVTCSLSHLKRADIDGCAYLSVSVRAEQCHCPMGSWVAIQPLAGDLLAALVCRHDFEITNVPLINSCELSFTKELFQEEGDGHKKNLVNQEGGTAVLEGLVNTG